VNPPVLREPPVKLGVPPAAPVVIEPDAEFDPEAETQFRDLAYARRPPCPAAEPGRGRVVAVWGPAGAPGRTTVAIGVADEAARLGVSTLLVDADPYGGTVAPALGLLDETAGLALASRDAAAGRLDPVRLAQRSRQLRPRLRVLTGLPRADRWRELRDRGTGVRARRVPPVVCAHGGGLRVLRGAGRGADRHLGATARPWPRWQAADVVLCVGAAGRSGCTGSFAVWTSCARRCRALRPASSPTGSLAPRGPRRSGGAATLGRRRGERPPPGRPGRARRCHPGRRHARRGRTGQPVASIPRRPGWPR
jgi:hypothetical protein